MKTLLEVLAILAKIGLPAAIGWWIDLSLDGSQEKGLRRKLDDLWVRFDGVTWFNFGQQEGMAALDLFDRTFGPRLWSRRRWLSVCLVLLAMLLASCVFSALAYCLLGAAFIETALGAPIEFSIAASPRSIAYYGVLVSLSLPIQVFGLALSLSATRWLSSRVLRLTGPFSLVGFAGLLLLAALLLLVWQPYLVSLKMYPGSFGAVVFFMGDAGVIVTSDSLVSKYLFFSENRALVLPVPETARNVVLLSWDAVLNYIVTTSYYAADWFVGAIRIAFSAFFLGCFVARRLVHKPLSQLGFVWLTSGKPIFATLFAAISAIVVFSLEFIKALA